MSVPQVTDPHAPLVQATADLLAAYVELVKVLPGSELRRPAESALMILLSPSTRVVEPS